MARRRFDHLVLEISLAIGRRVPRYDLWLRLHDAGLDPEVLTPEQAADFCRRDLRGFLAQRGWWITPRALRRLERAALRFDPGTPTPEERVARYAEGG